MGQTTQQQRDKWLAAFHALAAEWGGQCLSDAYVNQSTQLDFECASGHRWSATPVNVYHKGSWCPHCNGNAKYSITDAHAAAKSHGGICLSTEYVSVHQPLRWQCLQGHHFSASLTSVKTMGGFCMECQKLTLDEFQRLCDSIHYMLLSDTYVNNYTKIHVLCDQGHSWRVQPKHLKEGRRCPLCRKGIR